MALAKKEAELLKVTMQYEKEIDLFVKRANLRMFDVAKNNISKTLSIIKNVINSESVT
jgi:hypothetical protein